jgi:hypothetical protein
MSAAAAAAEPRQWRADGEHDGSCSKLPAMQQFSTQFAVSQDARLSR